MVKRITAVGAALLLLAGCTDMSTEPGSSDLSLDESTTDSSAGPIETTGVSAAQAVQYAQSWPGEFTAGFASLTGASRWQMADNFTPTADWNVTELEWVGVYIPPRGGVASPRSFVIEFFDDVDGAPDATAFHTETVTATLTTTGVRAGYNEAFDHTGASLGSPISFSAGVTYWLSIMDDDPSASQEDGFFWSTTLTGDGIVQRFDKRDWSTVLNRDLAFTLIGGAGITVEIDIKPGSDLNSINCNNENGSIAVAVLTTDYFDATTVNHTTLTFEGASETHVDKKTGMARRHEEDVDGDGDTDLVLHFRLGDTDLSCDSTEGTLTGHTFDGADIELTDAVRMIDQGGGKP